MIQLKVHTDNVILGWTQDILLDLYEEDQPKLTLSIEDITTTKTTTAFSRAFRVPATNKNTEYFKTAFEINGYDFDVTAKRSATILFDGSIYKKGEIRLQKIFKNDTTGKIDYELIFLGDVVDLATQIGEDSLRMLDTTDLIHNYDWTNISNSWQAYPENGFNNLNDGILGGDVIYPLVNFGNTYDDDGYITAGESRIKNGPATDTELFVTAGGGGGGAAPLRADKFRPMIRAKYIIDKIFDRTTSTYSSDFLNSNLFRQLYVSAWGNKATSQIDPEDISEYYDSGGILNNWIIQASDANVEYTLPIDYTLFGDESTFDYNTGRYTVQSTELYRLSIRILFRVITVNAAAGITLTFKTYKNPLNPVVINTDIKQLSPTNLVGGYVNHHIESDLNFTTGDIVWSTVTLTGMSNISHVEFFKQFTDLDASVSFVSNPTSISKINPGLLLADDYTQSDFLKDIITRFRLVIVKDNNIHDRFIIEPWETYIASGDMIDWTDKLDELRPAILEPIFYNQKKNIIFSDNKGGDFLNNINTDMFTETYGTLKLEVNNTTLKGTRKVSSKFTATPTTQIKGAHEGPLGMDNCIIPQIHSNEIEYSEAQTSYVIKAVPIKPKTRLMFYDGIQSTGTVLSRAKSWFFLEGATTHSTNDYPMVSQFSEWPLDTQTVDLSWQRENTFIRFDMANINLGNSCYTEFWSFYTDTLYNKWSRRLTANFILSSDDLLNFSFDDVIFVKDAYFYVEKIHDVIIGQESSVKVDLIKLLDYHPPVTDFILPAAQWEDISTIWNSVTPFWEDV